MLPAIILAAGLSRRMGRFKLTLPWGETTVIGQVVTTLEEAGLDAIIAVTGHRAAEVEAALTGTAARLVHNPAYAAGEMLSSIQVGLGAVVALKASCPAALLCLGDQPQMEVTTVRAVLAAGAAESWARIVIPSYELRAGHPILLPAWLWPEILSANGSLRAVLTAHRAATHYLVVATPSVLADVDTPEAYEAGRRDLEKR